MNKTRAKEITDQFATKKILVVGDVVLDQYVYGSVERINPEAPVPVLHAHRAKIMSGGAGNVAKNAAGLGATTALIAVTGDEDVASEEISAAAKAEGYTPHLVRDKSRPTTRKVRYIAQSQQTLRVDYEETHELSGALEKKIIAQIGELAKKSDGIIVSDYAKGVVTQKIATTLLAAAKEHHIPLAADLKPSRASWFTGASFVAPNLKEARQFLGLDPFDHDGQTYAQLAEALRQKMKTDIFLTLSAEGVYVLTHDVAGQHVPQLHAVQVADTSGAGDTATVVILLAQLCGASPVEAAELANAAGAVVVSKLGAVGVTVPETLAMISSLPQEK